MRKLYTFETLQCRIDENTRLTVSQNVSFVKDAVHIRKRVDDDDDDDKTKRKDTID